MRIRASVSGDEDTTCETSFAFCPRIHPVVEVRRLQKNLRPIVCEKPLTQTRVL